MWCHAPGVYVKSPNGDSGHFIVAVSTSAFYGEDGRGDNMAYYRQLYACCFQFIFGYNIV